MQSVLVTVDALRADHVAQYGYDRDTMPVLDRLLENGTRFESAYTNGPHSGISIPSFLTSQYSGHEALEAGPNVATALSDTGVLTGGIHSNTMIADTIDSFAGFESLVDFDLSGGESSDHRFETPVHAKVYARAKRVLQPVLGNVGAVRSLVEAVVPIEHRFDHQAYVNAEETTDRALSWIADHANESFFLWLHYMDPHRPYGLDPDPPTYLDSRVSEAQIKSLMARAGKSPESISEDERRLLRDLYDSDIRYTSNQLDRLLDGIDQLCDIEDLLFVLTADHGEEFAEHGYYFHVNRPYDELIHVPLVVSHPDHPTEAITDQRELIDLAPTICEFHDVPSPSAFGGKSLFAGDSRRVLTSGSLRDDDAAAGIRFGGWKYLRAGDDEELYDLSADPGEQRDVAAIEQERVAELRENVPQHLLRTNEEIDPETATGDRRQRLEDLGYLD